MKNGGTTSLEANVKTYNGTINSVTPDVIIVSGEECIEVKGNTITAKNAGTVYVMLRYTARLTDMEEDVYDIYSSPVKIQIGNL